MSRYTFIKESPLAETPEFCQWSVNTFFKPTEEYLFDYFNFSAFKDTYDRIFFELTRRLIENESSEKTSYLGVELLSCFKPYLFNYASSSAILISALINFIKANPHDIVYISKDGHDRGTPNLYQAISACLPEAQQYVRSVKFAPKTLHEGHANESTVISALKSYLWPKEMHFSFNKPTIAFFSDYQRIKCFIPSLRNAAIFFTNCKSPKTFFLSLKERISYKQIGEMGENKEQYAKVADSINQQMQNTNIFKGMKTEECDLEIILKQKINQLCQSQLPGLLYQIDKMHRFFIKRPFIKTVLLDEDITPPKNAFCKIARKHSVSSFVECHGSLYGAYSFLPLSANRIFAWGSEQKNTLVQWGCPIEKIVTSGCSRYQQYQQPDDAKVRKKIFRQFKFDEGVKTIVFVPQSRLSELCFIEKIVFERIESILDIILKYPNLQIIIKLHPSDTGLNYYKNRCNQPDVRCKVRILKKFDPYLLIKSSDFMIVHDSTMAIDGFALERNVIFFPAAGATSRILRHSVSDFEKYNVFYRPSNMEDFKNIFEQLLQNSQLRPEGAMWQKARENCLNENGSHPEDVIKSYLLNNE